MSAMLVPTFAGRDIDKLFVLSTYGELIPEVMQCIFEPPPPRACVGVVVDMGTYGWQVQMS
jgi:hypothetical protein